MTIDITDQLRRIVYAGNDTTGPFSFPFEVINETDLGVYVNSTLLTITSDYTVSLNADGTGSITLVIGTTLSDEPTSSDSIGIFGNKGIQRQTDFTTGGDLFANSLNDEFDAQTIFAQQNSEAILRSIRAPITDPTSIDMLLPAKDDRKGTLLAFDSTTGNPTVGITLGDAATLQNSLDDIALVADLEDGTIASNSISYIGDNQSNITTVANNISDINRYANEYKIQASAPSSPSEGDLWYSTTSNALYYYDGTVWQPAITSLSGDLTPELGGDLNTNAYSIIFGSTSGEKLTISNDGSVSTIASGGTTNLSITAGNYITFSADGQTAATLQGDADSTFYHTGIARLTIQNTGIDVNGDVGGDTLSISGNGTISGNLTVTGNLQVDGTTTTINTTTLDVEDKNITIAKNSANASVADGAGITVDLGTNDPVIANPTITYNSTDDDWEFNKGLDVTGDIVVSGTVDGVDIQTLNTTAGSALQNIVEDTSPQLGGTLDLNSNTIYGYGTLEAWGSTTSQDEVVTSISMIDKANGTGDTGKIVFEAMGRPGSTFNEEYPDLHIKQYVSGTTDALRTRIKLQGSTGYINLYDANGNETFVYNNEGRINTTKQVTTEEAYYANNGGGSTVGTLLAGATEVSLGSTSSNDVKFLVGNLEKARLTTDGNLGIGTSSPTFFSGYTTVHHKNESGNAAHLIESDGGVISQHYVSDSTGVLSGIVGIGSRSNHDLRFTTNNTERMLIDTSGNVGIGTANPASALDVTGVITTDGLTTSADINFGDNDKAIFGAGSDLQIYHDGSNSYVRDAGTGRLNLRSDGAGIDLQTSTGETMVRANVNGAVTLYYDNSAKLATTSTGIDVTGTVTADGLTVSTGDSIELSGGAGELIKSPTAGLIATESRGSFSIFTDTNNNGSATGDAFVVFDGDTYSGGTAKRLLTTNKGGDISFYEDTGTTAKFFWDASAESLGVGTTNATYALRVVPNVASHASTGAMQIQAATNGSGKGLTINSNTRTSADNSVALLETISRDNTTGLKVQVDGNVGIGTSSPSAVGSRTTTNIKGSAGAALRLSDDTANLYLDYTDTTGGRLFVNAAEPMAFGTSSLERMRIDSSGNVGIGTSSPEEILDLSDTFPQNLKLGLRGYLGQTNSTSGTLLGHSVKAKTVSPTGEELVVTETNSGGGAPSAIYMSSGNIEFHTAGAGTAGATFDSERMRIDSSGNLLVGKTTSNAATRGTEFRSSGVNIVATAESTNPCYFNRLTSDGMLVNFAKASVSVGSVSVTSSSTSYNTSSDYRLKTDVQPMTGATERLKALNPVNFEWISSGERVDGFLAHEAQEVVPEAVTGTKDAVDAEGNPEYQGIDQSKLVPLLVATVQEQQAVIESLTARIEALEN